MFYSCGITKDYDCGTTKDYDYVKFKEIPKEAVNIAITDFYKTLQRQNDSSIVAVRIGITYTSTDWFYVSVIPWIDEANKYPIEILDAYMGQIPPSHIPTEYIKKKNILFVWHNPQVALTENIKSILVKYDLVSYPDEDWVYVLDGDYTSYIFCKYNYKKRFNRKLKTQYRTPLPSCGCK